jgi:hypothetical protein
MTENEFRLPTYAALKLTRHGQAVDRLVGEVEEGRGEFASHPLVSALAFDAADFIWATLMTKAPAAQQDRAIRNRIAETITQVLSEWDGLPDELRQSF